MKKTRKVQSMKRKLGVLMSCFMVAAAALSGCQSGSQSGSQTSESKAPEKKEINLLAWGGISDEGIQKLEELTGYKINYTSFSTLEEMQSKCMSKSMQYDVAMSSDYIIEALTAQNKLEEIDTTKLSNYGDIKKGYLSPSYDPDNKWSVPYSGGGIGILVNRDVIKDKITSYADLWNPAFSDQIVFRDDTRIALSIGNLVNGNDFNASDKDQIKAAGEKITELLPNIHAFANSGYKLLLNGEANILVTSSADAYKAAKELGNWEYINPSEGTHMWMDSYVIPKGANMDAAYAYINAVISNEYLTRKGDETNWGYGYTNGKVEEKALASGISQDLMNISYPSDDVYAKAHYMSNIGDAALNYDEVWTEVKLKAGTKISQ